MTREMIRARARARSRARPAVPAFEADLDQVDDVVRQRGQVGDGLVLDLAGVAVGTAQVRRGLVLAVALLFDVAGLGNSDYVDFIAASDRSQIITL
jgi:hypothetical protein